MELKFLGRGSAFNPKEGNTSAYFIEDDSLFLIDCGESVFGKLMELELFDGIQNIYVMITHTHSDHVGSLGTLIMYSYFNMKRNVNLIVSRNSSNLDNIISVIKNSGITDSMYNVVLDESFDGVMDSFNSIRFVPTSHVSEINSYGILFDTSDGILYYSGDSNDVNVIRGIFESGKLVDKVYVDVTSTNYIGNVHLNVNVLRNNLTELEVGKIYCMHFNDDYCIQEAEKLGFNIVSTSKSMKKVLK